MKLFAVITSSLLALSLSISFVGCTPSSSSNSAFIPQQPLLSIQDNIQNAKTWCLDESHCPEDTGYILATTTEAGQTGLSQCTGFLVAPGIIATNSHCIPEDLKDPGTHCSARIAIKFPASHGKAEEAHVCDQILLASSIAAEHAEEFLLRPDYAFFSLRTTSTRQPLKISRIGIRDGTSVSLQVVRPMSDLEPKGQLEVKSCLAVKGTDHAPADTHPQADVAIVFGEKCEVYHGNSGSPTVTNDGRVVGLLHGGVVDDNGLRQFPAANRTEPLQRPAFLTNLSCPLIPSSIIATDAPPPECEPAVQALIKKRAIVEKEKHLRASAQSSLQTRYQEWLISAPSAFQFSAASAVKTNAPPHLADLDISILCMRPRSKWNDSTLLNQGSGTQTRFTTSVLLPTYELVTVYDRYMRASIEARLSSQIQQTISFYPDRVAESPSEVGEIQSFAKGSSSQPSPLILRLCKPDELQSSPLIFKMP